MLKFLTCTLASSQDDFNIDLDTAFGGRFRRSNDQVRLVEQMRSMTNLKTLMTRSGFHNMIDLLQLMGSGNRGSRADG